MNIAELHPKRFFLETWQRMDAEAQEGRTKAAAEGKGYDYRPLVVFCVGAVCLTLMEYFGSSRTMYELLGLFIPLGTPSEASPVLSFLRDSEFRSLIDYCWWAGTRVLGYLVVPLVSLKLMGLRVRDYGLETRGFRDHAWIYLLCYGVVFVCVIVVSFSDEFSSYYPFYKLARRSWLDFLLWELLYAAQFFSLEFFFRGYWLMASKRMMGSHAIFAMVVPYCMIHFGKPWIEAIAAIIAGVVLGTLAMKTRSIWSGFLIHVSVAITMDLAALMQNDNLPREFLP